MKAGCRFVIVGLISIVCLFILIRLILTAYSLNLPWTGFGPQTTEPKQHAKTLWDWLQLLIIPAVLAVGGFVFTYTMSKNEREATERRTQVDREVAEKHAQIEREVAEKRAQAEFGIALDNQREASLKEYFEKISELLLHENLRRSDPDDEVRKIARVWTLTVLQRLDEYRKGSVIQFLYESGLIDKDKCIIDLDGADLSKAYLDLANLSNADLSGTNLVDAVLTIANLSNANLSRADMIKSFLWQTNLRGADLANANLLRASLNDTKLDGADLTGAYLQEVTGITNKELEKQAKSLKGATMPDGSIHR